MHNKKKGKLNSKIKGTILTFFVCHLTNMIPKPWTSSSHRSGIPPPNTLIWGVGGKKSNFWTWAHCFIIPLELMNKHQLDEFTFGVGLLHALPIQRKAQKSFPMWGATLHILLSGLSSLGIERKKQSRDCIDLHFSMYELIDLIAYFLQYALWTFHEQFKKEYSNLFCIKKVRKQSKRLHM